MRPAPDIRRFAPPFWSTLSTHPLVRMAPLKCLFAPTGSARAGRAPGFNGNVPANGHVILSRTLARIFHTLSSRDAARAGLARRPTRFLAGLYEDMRLLS